MGQLSGKVAIVTGANTGIGFAIAQRFATEGASVVLAGRDNTAIAEAVAGIARAGGTALPFHYDAFVEADADALVAFACEHFGGLDICVPNAGGTFGNGLLAEIATDNWRQTMALNADAAFFLFRAAARSMIPHGGGVLLAISSIASIRSSGSLQYAAAKGAVNAMVMNLSVQLASHNIRINGILPGPTDTRAMRRFMNTPEIERAVAASVPLGKVGQPGDIAALALFLASDQSSFITGQLVTADGGLSQK